MTQIDKSCGNSPRFPLMMSLGSSHDAVAAYRMGDDMRARSLLDYDKLPVGGWVELVSQAIEARQVEINRNAQANPSMSDGGLLNLNHDHFRALAGLYAKDMPEARVRDAMLAAMSQDDGRCGAWYSFTRWRFRFLADHEIFRRLTAVGEILITQHMLLGNSECSVSERHSFIKNALRRRDLADELARRNLNGTGR
jgi:hypothetical protein